MFIGLSAFNITGFNRTFMELKYWSIEKVAITKVKFQSYLYGIEMKLKKKKQKGYLVSIVPLWN